MSDTPPADPNLPATDAPSPKPRAPYEGPFKKRALEKARADAAEGTEPRPSAWLSSTRLYLVGVVLALGITAFYVSKLMVRPDEILRSAQDATQKPPPPPPIVRAYCLRAQGELAPVEPRPFCTAARPPSCDAGEVMQFTYAPRGTDYTHVHLAIVDERFATTLVAQAEAVRADAQDAPVGQWKVAVQAPRQQVAVVGLFSRAPLTAADVAPFFESWRDGARLLARPPSLTPALAGKSVLLSAFLACVGRPLYRNDAIRR